MATETLDEKKPEGEAPAKDKDGAEDLEEETVSRASDGRKEKEEVEKAKKEEVKNEETEEKSETDDRESEDEEEEEKDDKKEKASEKEPVTPVTDRPKRERKKVERYSLPTPSRSSGSKGVSIEKGRGTQLREIPNVAYKLSKRKPDDNLLLLHTILYGKKAKAQTLKKNIGQFSGYVWSEKEEEKQRMRVKDKLEKCIKEKLIDFCDVLDIPINKSNVRKEELSEKVLEFLEYPKATREILLADQVKQGKKRKMAPKNVSSGEASDIPAKKKRQRKKAGKKQGLPSEAEGDDESEGIDDSHEGDNAAMKEESDHKDIQTDEEEDEAEDGKSSDKKSSGAKGKEKMASAEDTRVKSSKGSSKSGQKPSKRAAKSTSSSTKKQKVERESEKDQNDSSQEKGKKQSNKPRARGSKDEGKGKDGKKGKAEPTREEMHAVVANILKEVDFNTATLSDILRKLGDHFSVDLLHRKAEVKDIITEAINNMTDDEEDEEDNP